MEHRPSQCGRKFRCSMQRYSHGRAIQCELGVTFSLEGRGRNSNYKRLRVHDAKGYWQQSTLKFQPEIIFQLDTLLDLKAVFRLAEKQVLGKVKSRDKDGVRQKLC